MSDALVPGMTEETSLAAEDPQAKLEHFKALATKQYALKNYEAAAEHYSEAAEVSEIINGEMSPESADLLYQYGRCLYHVAVANSDVLGGKVASTEEPKRKKRKVSGNEVSESATAGSSLIGDAIKNGEAQLEDTNTDSATATLDSNGSKPATTQPSSNPYFQITGDENFTDSEDDDEDGEAAGGGDNAEEVEDDFATAYEILDMARVLLARKLEALETSPDHSSLKSKGKQPGDRPEIRQIKERLADTHDLQAEISLENERFPDAVHDMRAALALKKDLHPPESSLVAEAHFKLSLALEFASVTQTSTAADDTTSSSAPAQPAQIDEAMRAEAATHLEEAIASCKLRIAQEEGAATAAKSSDPSKAAQLQRSITDVKEMVTDMQQRLVDLRAPAVSLSGLQGGGAGAGDDPLRGVLGAILGGSAAEQQQRLAAATEQANDLSGLVKHKKKSKVEGVAAGSGAEVKEGKSEGKRKAEDEASGEKSAAAAGKRVKFDAE